MTALIGLQHIGEFFDKLTEKWPYFLFFGFNFFRIENRENFPCSTDRNMVFLLIFSYIPLLYDPMHPPSQLHLGGCLLENGGNLPKTNFIGVSDHLSEFKNYAFSISKKIVFTPL